MGKILVIGESPTPGYPKPFTGPIGTRLAQIVGTSEATLFEVFDFVNIFDEPRIGFPVGLAKERWDEVSDLLLHDRPRIILASMCVADVIICGKITNRRRNMRCCEWIPRPDGGELAIVPRLTGSNHWYNSSANRNSVRRFLNTCMEAS